VGARADRLVLASVKSYVGSHGVVAEHVSGETRDEKARKRYSSLNRREVSRAGDQKRRRSATATAPSRSSYGSTWASSRRAHEERPS